MVIIQFILLLENMCGSDRFCNLNYQEALASHATNMAKRRGGRMKTIWSLSIDITSNGISCLSCLVVHCFCLYTVYVKRELNKPIHDLIYLPNGLNICSVCLKGNIFQFSLACRWYICFPETEPLYSSLPTFPVI